MVVLFDSPTTATLKRANEQRFFSLSFFPFLPSKLLRTHAMIQTTGSSLTVEQYGFYRVDMEEGMWEKLAEQLNINHEVCSLVPLPGGKWPKTPLKSCHSNVRMSNLSTAGVRTSG